MPSCAAFTSVTCSKYFKYLDFSDFSSSVWKPLRNLLFSCEGFGKERCLKACSLSTEHRRTSITARLWHPHGSRAAAPCPSGALFLVPLVQMTAKSKWCVCCPWGTDSLCSCPLCSVAAGNLASNPSIFTIVRKLTQESSIHGSCTFSSPKSAAGEHSAAYLCSWGNIYVRVEHMIPLPSKNLQSGLNDKIRNKTKMEPELESLLHSNPGDCQRRGLQVIAAAYAGS